MNQAGQDVFTFGAFCLHPGERKLTRDGQPLFLTPKEFDTLLILVEAEGRVVHKEEMIARVWPDSYVGDGSLARNISVLRKALREEVIETLPRLGYRLAIPVTRSTPEIPPRCTPENVQLFSQPAAPSPEVETVNRSGYGLVALLGSLAVAIAAVIGTQPSRHPPMQSFPPAWVLIAPFENRTGGFVPEGVREYNVTIELNHSRYARPVPADRVRSTLTLMRRPLTTVLTPDIAREVCLRDGDIRLLISGRLEKLDGSYLLTSNLVDPDTGATVLSITERAEGQNQLLPAVRKLSERISQEVDDHLPQITERFENLEKVTTSSFHALELYSSASKLLAQNDGANAPAVDLLKEAVDLDPQFLSAEALLTRALSNLEREAESRPYLRNLFEQAGTMPDHERYFILGSYYEGSHQPRKAAEQYEALVRLYPDHFWGIHRLADLYRNNLQRPDAAIPYFVRRADLRPSDFVYSYQAWQLLTDLKKQHEIAERYRARGEKLATPQVIEQFPFPSIDLLLARTNRFIIEAKPEAALNEIQRLGHLWESLGPNGRAALSNRLAVAYASLGRLKDAKRWLAHAGEGMAHDYAGGNIADAEGDYGKLLYYLRHLDEKDKTIAQVAAYLARFHEMTEAQRLLRKLEKQPGFASAEDHWIRGELARASGNFHVAKAELKAALGAFTISDDAQLRGELPLVSEALADLLQKQGDIVSAIAVLEPLASLELDHYGEFPEYARVLVRLSRFYQQVQRFQDREKIDAQLRARFAVADPDYFAIRYLQGESTRAARGPEVASAKSVIPY